MGIYRLIRYNPTQTTINPTTIFSRGIFVQCFLKSIPLPILRPLNGVRLSVPGGCGRCIQGFADFLRESKECKRFMQERGSLLDTFPQQGILGVAGHEQDHQSGPQFPGAFGEFAFCAVSTL